MKSIRVDYKIAKFIVKVIPIFKYHVCTGYGISKLTYGNKKNHHSRMGQGNLFLGESYKDKLNRNIKEIEDEKLGAITIAPITEKEV